MAINRAHTAFGQVFYQRCFYLFVAVLALLMAALLSPATPRARIVLGAVSVLLDISAVAALGRTRASFILALLLALPALVYQFQAVLHDDPSHALLSWSFNVTLYAVTTAYLLRYVFRADVMTSDKFYGAAAAYLMLGATWAFLYAIVEYYQPGSFTYAGASFAPPFVTLMYFSFTVLTSTGFGDIVPASQFARGLCVLEQLAGALFLAILIARLAGVYPPRRRDS